MGYNFPNTPSTGQTYTPSGGPTYTWDGTAWKAISQGVPVTVYVSDTAPPSPAVGQLWWNSTTGNMCVWYADPDSAQWVQVSGNVAQNAPQDGGEYVMVNGVWRLKSQTFDMTGLLLRDITVPAWGPSQIRISLNVYVASACAAGARLSVDGTNFYAGATDYNYGGFYQNSNTAPTAVANTGTNMWQISGTGDNISVPLLGTTIITLTRGASKYFFHQTQGTCYNNGGFYQTLYYQGYAGGIIGSANVKAVRVLSTAAAFASGNIAVEWVA